MYSDPFFPLDAFSIGVKALKRFIPVLLVVAAVYFFQDDNSPSADLTAEPGARPAPAATQASAPNIKLVSGLQAEGSGTVIRVLSDDNDGSRHQRFIVELASGQTLLIAHNIDLAPRVNGLQKGDQVEFYGEFESNPQGGVIHWTHHDPQGRHPDGWLRHRGRKYQ
jgi:hypothetical protein